MADWSSVKPHLVAAQQGLCAPSPTPLLHALLPPLVRPLPNTGWLPLWYSILCATKGKIIGNKTYCPMASITLPDEASPSVCVSVCVCRLIELMSLCVYLHMPHVHVCVQPCPLYFLSDHRNVHGLHAHSFKWHRRCHTRPTDRAGEGGSRVWSKGEGE